MGFLRAPSPSGAVHRRSIHGTRVCQSEWNGCSLPGTRWPTRQSCNVKILCPGVSEGIRCQVLVGLLHLGGWGRDAVEYAFFRFCSQGAAARVLNTVGGLLASGCGKTSALSATSRTAPCEMARSIWRWPFLT